MRTHNIIKHFGAVAFYCTLFVCYAYFSSTSIAAVNLPWSTTFNCADWTQSGGSDPICDGIKHAGNWVCSPGNVGEQISAVANFPGGGGGKGQIHYIGPGTNVNSGGLNISFNTPQSEFWMRYYIKYDSGFSFSNVSYNKQIYVNVTQVNMVIPELKDADKFSIYVNQDSRYNLASTSGHGWASVFSDHQWHCIEFHIKYNTTSSSPHNGIAEAWIDGIQVINYRDVYFGAPGGKWDGMTVGENASSVNNSGCIGVFYDDIAISNTGLIGPIPSSSTHTITATAGPNGSISPSATTSVSTGSSQQFIITPNVGQQVAEVLVDGSPVGAVTSYTFTNVTTNHTIAASFTAVVPGSQLISESFADGNWRARGWYDGVEVSPYLHGIVDTNVKYAGTGSLRYDWAQGASQPTNGLTTRYLFTATDSVYISVYIMLGSGWVGSGLSYHPHLICLLSDLDGDYDGLANNYLNTYVEVNGSNPRFEIQDGKNIVLPHSDLTGVTENRAVAGCNGGLGDTGSAAPQCYDAGGGTYWNGEQWQPPTTLTTGAWHHYEGYFKMNTISGGKAQADGVMRMWIDGNLVLNKTNIVYRTNQHPTMKWRQIALAPYIGDGSPKAQSLWLDELMIGRAEPSISLAPPSLRIE